MTKQSPGYSLPKAPTYEELPTAKPRAVRSGPELAELRVRLEVVTPILGGSHQTRAIDDVDVIRVPSVRGQLRFWWRALYGSRHANPEDLYQREIALWGRAATGDGGRSAAEIRVGVERVGGQTMPTSTCSKRRAHMPCGQRGSLRLRVVSQARSSSSR